MIINFNSTRISCIDILCVILFLSHLGCKPQQPDVSPPNILLIISDDQSWTDYGFMGHDYIQTPRLDQLARESLLFTRGYATAPLCSPSLASIITGLYAYQHGITGNDPAFQYEGQRYSKDWRIARQSHFDRLKQNFYQNKLLTEYLSEAGYQSLQTGKWWLGSWEEGHFDSGMTHGDPANEGRHGDDGLTIGRDGMTSIYDFIDESKDDKKPFFVWYAPFLPHTPHDPPDSLLQKYLAFTDSEPIARYWAMCEWFDQTCGDLINYIDAQELSEETLIIFTADNGWIQKADAKNRYDERSKRSPYEMGIRTPFMLRWPGTIVPKRDTLTQVSNIDIVPTILSASNINTEAPFPGVDLLARNHRETREVVFSEAYEHDISDIEVPTRSLQYKIALAYPWKLIMADTNNIKGAKFELYNLQNDPDELDNLSDLQIEKRDILLEKIDQWWNRY